MLRLVIIVAVVLVFLSYSMLFLTWNAETKVNVITLKFGDPLWVEGVPIAFLPLVGLVIGVVVMAIAAWIPWSGQRKLTHEAEAKLQRAMSKLGEQKKALAARDQDIAELSVKAQQGADLTPVDTVSAPTDQAPSITVEPEATQTP